MKKLLLFLCLLASLTSLGRAYRVNEIENVLHYDSTQLVSNQDKVLSPSDVQDINQLLLDIRHKTSAEVAVVVIRDFDADDIDEFATELFNHWGIGKGFKDNGVLVLAAIDRHKMTIRTGYGAEGILPDILCGYIIREKMTPLFKEGRYGAGLLKGVEEIHRLMCDPKASEELQAKIKKENENGVWIFFGLLLGFAGFVAWRMRKKKKDANNKLVQDEASDDETIVDGAQAGSAAAAGAAIADKVTNRLPRRTARPRSSSGGSFGGGRTGGGGASGSW